LAALRAFIPTPLIRISQLSNQGGWKCFRAIGGFGFVMKELFELVKLLYRSRTDAFKPANHLLQFRKDFFGIGFCSSRPGNRRRQ
jgi:hypothetical protein